MLNKKDALERAVSIADGTAELARRITAGGRKVSQQAISLWCKAGEVPASGWAIHVSRAVQFAVTPHELDPVGYPNHWDGLPLDRARPIIQEAVAA